MTCCLSVGCIKKETCKRHQNFEYAVVNHQAICDEETNYKWYWHDEDKASRLPTEEKGEDSNGESKTG